MGMRQLAGSALITGASGAIGGAIARALAEKRVRVALCGRDDDRLRALAASLGEDVALRYSADFADEAALRQLAESVLTEMGGVDLLIHTAGHLSLGAIAEMPLADLDRHLAINLRAPWLLTQLLLPSLRERHGQIAFVNSSVSPRRGQAAYVASKHALRAFADSLRQEVNADGVRVVSVFPGRTASAMQAVLHREAGQPYQAERLLQPEDIAAALLAALQLPDTAELTDLHLRPMRP